MMSRKGCSDHADQGTERADSQVALGHLRIPPFPQIAIRLLQLTDNEDVSMSRVSALISSEPAFSTEVLTIANSALYGVRSPVTSVLQAVAVLGTNASEPVSYCRSESLPWRVAQQ